MPSLPSQPSAERGSLSGGSGCGGSGGGPAGGGSGDDLLSPCFSGQLLDLGPPGGAAAAELAPLLGPPQQAPVSLAGRGGGDMLQQGLAAALRELQLEDASATAPAAAAAAAAGGPPLGGRLGWLFTIQDWEARQGSVAGGTPVLISGG